ncbi:MAG: hypothetical protein H3C68_00020 [Deltaproteobacteria bacterium]|nr:hypothetical protein [Deltaproteobacteria bacterium]MBZ0219708.1 hypothetical protein [Deltaproteobacteria bacterium]
MARRMNFNEFVSFEKGLSEEKAAEETASGADGNPPIPPGVYYLLSETSVLLLSEKSCSKPQ